MKKSQVTLDQALRISLPIMIKDNKALDAIVEILEEYIYWNNFDVGSNIVETITGKGDFGEFDINIQDAIVEILKDCIYSDNFDVRSNVVKTITGKGGDGEFGINIHEFHGVFWISAPEFDVDGYFTNIVDAKQFAEVRYEPFITNYLSEDE